MNNESKDRLTDLVQHAKAETLESLSCPDCGGGLIIQYTSRAKGALSLACDRCSWRVVRDGIPAEPPWVRELGPKVKTSREPIATQPRR